MVGHAQRQDMIRDYGLRATWANLDAEALAQKALRTREDAEDSEGLRRFYLLLQARSHELEAGAASYVAAVYADDQERHRAERDGREPEPRTFLQRRPPRSGSTWGELIRAYVIMTVLVAALFAVLSAVGIVGGVTVALTWPPTQAAILAGLWWGTRDGGSR